MVKLKIYIFRHGQTAFNRDGRFTGWMDSRLTDKGFKNARLVGKKLAEKKFEVAFCSSLTRSKQTLKEVVKFHPECKEIKVDDRIRERNYGRLNGTGHNEFIRKIGKKLYDLEVHGDIITELDEKGRKEAEKFLGKAEYEMIHRGYNVPPPGGESFAMVEKRVSSFIKDLVKMMKKKKVNVAISAHGNSIRLFRKVMEKASVAEACDWVIPYDNYFEYTLKV